MDVQLYIGDVRADLGNAGEFVPLWTYTRDDADAPAAVRNSYTKTVTLAATPANNGIFNHIGRLDRQTLSGQFTPLARVPFQLYNGRSEIIDRGYVKLESIARRGPLVVSYDVTLYGGIGSLLYGLTFAADGSRLTLGDLSYPLDRSDEQTARPARDIQVRLDSQNIAAAWAAMSGGPDDSSETGLLNFAPCQNGIPDRNFDAGKAYYKRSAASIRTVYDGISFTFQDDDQVTYTTRSDANGGVLIDLGMKATEWEVQDFRATQQRPVIRLCRIFEAMTLQENDTGSGWQLTLDPDFFKADNPWWENAWLTLPIPTLNGADTDLAEILGGTASPADYLVSYAKLMGLVFVPDTATGTVALMSRDKFYQDGGNYQTPVDLSDRIGGDGEDVAPYLMTSRIYDFQLDGAAAFVDSYRERYGREYGGFRVDSGYMFDAAAVDVLKGSSLRNAADVRESSPWFRIYGRNPLTLSLKQAAFQLAKYQLYNEGADSIKSKTLQVEFRHATSAPYAVPALPQFHDESGKPTDGADALVFFTGMQTIAGEVEVIPGYVTLSQLWHLSDDNAAMLALNNGVPCWNISPEADVTPVTSIPVFRRWLVPTGSTAAQASWDLGTPSLIAVPGDSETDAVTIFPARWENYIADRFDVDALVLRARVDLSGLQVGPGLLRRFFWYRGSIWSLNKVEDYNPLTPGLTTCEFVRVKDVNNYVAGQTLITV